MAKKQPAPLPASYAYYGARCSAHSHDDTHEGEMRRVADGLASVARRSDRRCNVAFCKPDELERIAALLRSAADRLERGA